MKTMFCYGGITARKGGKDAYYYGRNYYARSTLFHTTNNQGHKMKFNPTTLRIIAQGDYVPDQQYVMEMAKALLQEVFIVPRLDGDKRPDGSPQWYDCYKNGVKRAEIYHAQSVNVYSIEVDGNKNDWICCKSLDQCESELKGLLK